MNVISVLMVCVGVCCNGCFFLLNAMICSSPVCLRKK
uniref:Uncharacterized protein n=1 Tax=Arundo donax TaxID=35708 RepID=A0A0A8YU78_ARUDO